MARGFVRIALVAVLAIGAVACGSDEQAGAPTSASSTIPTTTTASASTDSTTTVVTPPPPSRPTSTTVATNTTSPPTAPSSTTPSASCAYDALFPVVASVFEEDPYNVDYRVIDIEIAECQAGYARVFAIPDRTVCTTYGYRCMENEQLFLRDVDGTWVLIDMGTGLSCTDPKNDVELSKACQALGVA